MGRFLHPENERAFCILLLVVNEVAESDTTMVFFVAPFAVAGYRIYMKKKAERDAHEQLEEADVRLFHSTEKTAEESDDTIEAHDNDQNESTGAVRPIDKFLTFCRKLETRRQEAEERILQQFVKDSMRREGSEESNKQPSASLSNEKTNSTDSLDILNATNTGEVQGASHQGASSLTATGTHEESPFCQTYNIRIKRHQSSPSLAIQNWPSLHPVLGSAVTSMNRPRITSV